jgi:hypothetical protein
MNSKAIIPAAVLTAGLALVSCGKSVSTTPPLVPAAHNPSPTLSDSFASCYPATSKGKCYVVNEQCNKSQNGITGVGAGGAIITCAKVNGVWKWMHS